MTDEELTGRFDGIDQRFDGIDRRLDAVDKRFDGLETFIKDEGVATRRHFDVVAEGLRADITLIAEGHRALEHSVAELKAGQGQLETRLDRVEVQQLALESRKRPSKNV